MGIFFGVPNHLYHFSSSWGTTKKSWVACIAAASGVYSIVGLPATLAFMIILMSLQMLIFPANDDILVAAVGVCGILLLMLSPV